MKFKLTVARFEVLSEISRDIAAIFFASVFIGPLLSGEWSWYTIIIGLILSFTTWWLSLVLTK
jgi:hypothetical protein